LLPSAYPDHHALGRAQVTRGEYVCSRVSVVFLPSIAEDFAYPVPSAYFYGIIPLTIIQFIFLEEHLAPDNDTRSAAETGILFQRDRRAPFFPHRLGKGFDFYEKVLPSA
jgi:hypothetical protein